MKIGIDMQSTWGAKSGLGVYTTELVSNLRKIDPAKQYLLFGKEKPCGERTYERLFWENFILPGRASKEKIDVLHTPAFTAPFLKGKWRVVVTIHDLIGMIFPNYLSLTSRWYWGSWLPFVNRRSERIIVDSNCTKQDVVRYLKVDPQKIRVVHLSASAQFTNNKTQREIELVCHKFGIQRPYVLFVGNIEPRKNLLRVIKAFAKARKAKKLEHHLVIAGSQAWNYPAVNQLIEELNLSGAVNCLNYIDDEDLISLYNGGELLVFPSLYEGFGIPILEAMKCGMPVLTSNLSSIPEVAGNAAYYVDPYQEDQIEAGIATLLGDQKLREDLRVKGFLQAGKFGWKLTAQKTLAVYEELLN